MKLGIDLRSLPADGSAGAGIAHAARELTDALVHALPDGIELIGFLLPGATMPAPIRTIDLPDRRAGSLIRAVRSERIESMIFPDGTIPFRFPRSVRVFPWVHDITIFSHPEWFPQSKLQRWLTTTQFQRGLNRSEAIFAVSEYTKREMESRFGLSSDRIIVTGQGIEGMGTTWNPHQEKPYALMLGTVEPRKNIPFIIDLWPQVIGRLNGPMDLVIAGATGWGEVPIPSDRPWLRRIAVVSDQDRGRFIAGSSIVLLPSLDEGFGRVALEALSVGAPVVVSDRGALPEVVGDAALVRQLDPDRWIEGICHMLGQVDEAPIHMRKAQSKLFSWQKTAQIMLARILAG